MIENGLKALTETEDYKGLSTLDKQKLKAEFKAGYQQGFTKGLAQGVYKGSIENKMLFE
jgi:hypothetical protein